MPVSASPRLLICHDQCPAPLGTAFRNLNLDWIEEYFHVEESDQRILKAPEEHVLQPGGALLFLVADPARSADDIQTARREPISLQPADVLATCALIPHRETSIELAKMTVARSARGQGLGRRLLRAAVKEAGAMGYQRLVLTTSRRLSAAVSLYRSEGFEEDDLDLADGYDRGDLEMSCDLEMSREIT